MPPPRTVYILRSRRYPARHYVGVTSNLRARLREHDRADARTTARHAPWRLLAAFWFREEATARAFERYLKTGSGRAFAKRHFAGPQDQVRLPLGDGIPPSSPSPPSGPA